MGQLPGEIESFFGFASKWTDKYHLKTKFMKNNYIFTLSKICSFLQIGSEIVQIHISCKPIFYSIELQELTFSNTNNQETEYKTIYSIIVKGDNAIPHIIQDTEKILMKRAKIPQKSYYPF